MRKGLWLGLIFTLVACAFVPEAMARAPRRHESNVINVYWHDKEQLSDNKFRLSTWYVGVYESDDGIWSDLYQSVDRCRKTDRGHTRCRQETYRIGISDLEGETFTMDTDDLQTAHLDATYNLRTYDEHGNRVGGRVPTHIVADLTGRGDVRRSEETTTRRKGCRKIRTTYESAYRRATGTGFIDGQDIGTTRDAFLDTSTRTVHRLGCRWLKG